MNQRIVAFLFLILCGCSNQQKNTRTKINKQKEAPSWVSEIPENSNFYYGVGASPKVEGRAFISDAHERALSSLMQDMTQHPIDSSQIALWMKEGVLKEPNTNSGDTLNYEVFDEYENNSEYWVMYRLNKKQHWKNSEHQKQVLFSLAYSLFQQASTTSDYTESFILLAKALDALKPYWGLQNKYVTPDNQTIALENIVFEQIELMIKQIVIMQSSDLWLSVANNYQLPVQFRVLNQKEKEMTPLNNLPFTYAFNGNKTVFTSNAVGIIQTHLTVSHFKEQEGLITLTPAFDVLLNEQVSLETQTRINTMSKPSFQFEWQVQAPSIYVANSIPFQPYISSLKQAILTNGYTIVTNAEAADLVVSGTIESHALTDKQPNEISISLTLIGKNKQNELVYSHYFDPISAAHTEAKQAKDEAMSQLKQSLTHWTGQSMQAFFIQ